MTPVSFLRRLFGSTEPVLAPDRAEDASLATHETVDRIIDVSGLTTVRGVGEATVRNLAAAGFETVEEIGRASEAALIAVPGVGPTTAARLKAYATGAPEPPISRQRYAADATPAPFNASRRIDRAIHEMLGLCRGVLADGIVTTEEALLLINWMEANPDVIAQWPASALADRLDRIFADGVVEPHEQRELEALLREITGTLEDGEQAVGRTATLPLNSPPPALEFDGWEYVFTGRFACGTRRWCQQAVEARGGTITGDVRMRTNVLVVGTYGSRDWAHSSYGRKIQKAVDYRARGAPVRIVAEDHWSGFL
jgi:NAD-dependent DNA ligase